MRGCVLRAKCFLNILDWVINKFYFGSITAEVGKRDKEKMALVLFSKPVNCESTENQKREHMSEFLNACRNLYGIFLTILKLMFDDRYSSINEHFLQFIRNTMV